MKTMKLVKGSFAEIYADGLRFALFDSKGALYNATTCCKDFFTDAFWCEHHAQQTSIHGFVCKPGRMDLEAPTYEMVLHKQGESLEAKHEALAGFLGQFSEAFKFPGIIIEPVNDGADLLLSFPAQWASRPVMISLLTGMMRVGLMSAPDETVAEVFERLKKDGNPYGKYDKTEFFYGSKVVPLILSCLKNGTTPHAQQSFAQYKEAYSAHHGGGFIAFTDGRQTG